MPVNSLQKQRANRRFRNGQSGNPNRWPIGTRNKAGRAAETSDFERRLSVEEAHVARA